MTNTTIRRCPWCGSDPQYVEYHDTEWGVPKYDDQILFELLLLEGAQAGLSWITVLRKRDNYREAFDNFDAKKMAAYTLKKQKQLLENPGIIRNRLKISAFVKNANAYLTIKKEGAFSDFLWSFTQHKIIANYWRDITEVPTSTPESTAMSKALKKKGFSFVGPTICYAFMQSAGMVDDHLTYCAEHSRYK